MSLPLKVSMNIQQPLTARSYLSSFLIAVLLLGLFSAAVWAEPSAQRSEPSALNGMPLALDKSTRGVSLTPYVTYFCTPDKSLGLATISSRNFVPTQGADINFGMTSDVCWLRFSLRNTQSDTSYYAIEIAVAPLDHVDIYYPLGDQYQRIKLGDQLPFNQRALRVPLYTGLISFAPNETKLLYLRASTYNTLALPLSVSHVDSYIEDSQFNQWLSGMFYGFILGLVAFSLYTYFYFRDTAYVHHIVFLISMSMVFLILDGQSVRLWPEWVEWQDRSLMVTTYIGLGSGILFANYYLNIEELPRLRRFSHLLMWGFAISTILAFYIPLNISLIILTVMATLCLILLLSLSVVQLLRGSEPARYYTAGWFVFIVVVFLLILNSFGVIASITAPIMGLKLAFIFQQLLNAIGIGRKVELLFEAQTNSENEVLLMQAESKAKGDFLAKMSHEIRTPMNAVLGILQLLKDSTIKQEHKDMLLTAHRSGTTLLQIINDILDYSKVEAGMMQIESIPFDLKRLIAECSDMFTIPAQEKGITLNCEIDGSLPSFIAGDRVRLRQVLVNLYSNAFKFTSTGEIKLTARTHRLLEGGDSLLYFEVRDTGVGISREDIGRMFDSFQQADVSTTRNYGGSGLGLTICEQLVKLMGGEIGVDSELGQGATVWFTLQVKVVAEVEEIEDETSSSMEDLDGATVMVVEDNAVNMLVVTSMLARSNICVVVAEDGQQAVDKYRELQGALDLILMDCEMPNMDGFAATAAIRTLEHQSQLNATPIVALSAHVSADIQERCRTAGMDDYLPKPIEMTRLNNTLTKWLRKTVGAKK